MESLERRKGRGRKKGEDTRKQTETEHKDRTERDEKIKTGMETRQKRGRENQGWGPCNLSPWALGPGGALVQEAGSGGGLKLTRPLILLLSPTACPGCPAGTARALLSSAPSHVRGRPRAGRTSAGPQGDALAHRTIHGASAPPRGSVAWLDRMVGVGDVGLLGGQRCRERGTEESEAGLAPHPFRTGAPPVPRLIGILI